MRHLTILDNGVIENPEKRLYLGGVFGESDLGVLEKEEEKELRKMLKARKQAEKADACAAGDRKALARALLGEECETDLDSRALMAFPFLQSMPEKHAGSHIAVAPNSNFVRKRDDGTFGVAHCWPVKYNDDFRRMFKTSVNNWDYSVFSPRKAYEFTECMKRLFGKLGDARVLYCVKETQNMSKVLVGTSEQIVAFLRVRPALLHELNIAKLHPDGFIAQVVVKNKPPSEKQFRMQTDGLRQVLYVKKGYETMACCKPLDLFHKDCELIGEPIDIPVAAEDTIATY